MSWKLAELRWRHEAGLYESCWERRANSNVMKRKSAGGEPSRQRSRSRSRSPATLKKHEGLLDSAGPSSSQDHVYAPDRAPSSNEGHSLSPARCQPLLVSSVVPLLYSTRDPSYPHEDSETSLIKAKAAATVVDDRSLSVSKIDFHPHLPLDTLDNKPSDHERGLEIHPPTSNGKRQPRIFD